MQPQAAPIPPPVSPAIMVIPVSQELLTTLDEEKQEAHLIFQINLEQRRGEKRR